MVRGENKGEKAIIKCGNIFFSQMLEVKLQTIICFETTVLRSNTAPLKRGGTSNQ